MPHLVTSVSPAAQTRGLSLQGSSSLYREGFRLPVLHKEGYYSRALGLRGTQTKCFRLFWMGLTWPTQK